MRDLLLNMSWLMIGIAIMVFFALMKGRIAEYGRYTKNNGIGINPKLAWFIQEAPSFFIPLYFSFKGTSYSGDYLNCAFLVHYFDRVFIHSLRIRSTTLSSPSIVIQAFFFCSYNGFLQGSWNAFYQPEEEIGFRHIIGAILFFLGMFINRKADWILINLRAPGQNGYRLPRGFLFDYISCPNYFGEIVEWTGYAILAGNLPALAFAIFTAANIGPRALSHHAWYKQKFRLYPRNRKALIPFVI